MDKRAFKALIYLLISFIFQVNAQDIRGKIAIFDPEQGTAQDRFTLNLDVYNEAAKSLAEAGFSIRRLTLTEMADPEILNPEAFDALLLEGSTIPRSSIENLKVFTEKGGILINIGAGVPMLIAIEQSEDGLWQMSPMEPRFAWQTTEMHKHFGMKYIYDRNLHDTGKIQKITRILEPYFTAKEIPDQPFPHKWLIPVDEGHFYPLIRSRRVDGQDVTPQIFIAEKKGARCLISLEPLFTDSSRPDVWTHSKRMLVALAQVAVNLKRGELLLSEMDAVDISEKMPPPAPLGTRRPTSSVNPEDATPLIRWGRFDGSSLDLKDTGLPSILLPGETESVSLPHLEEETLYFRVRFAYNRSYAGLKISVDGHVLLNELFLYQIASGDSNHSSNRYRDVPVETQRIFFLPVRGEKLVVQNPGSAPLYLDALQIERRTKPAPERWVGTGVGMSSSYGAPSPIPKEVSARWSLIRMGPRTQFVGPPGDPARWDRVKKLMDNGIASNSKLNLIFEGTPEWAAISKQRYAEGVKINRPHVVPPDTDKYQEIVAWLVDNYQDHIGVYEIWNETDIKQFWRGSTEEYLSFARSVIRTIRERDPDTPIILAGMAVANEAYLSAIGSSDLGEKVNMIALHPYAGESASWDISYGQLQGHLYEKGNDVEIYGNESGFVWKNGEWFTSGWSEERQASALNTAMSRLLSGDLSKLSIFNAGGDDHLYGIYNKNGEPRPAALVFEDYVSIAQAGARRLDVLLSPADGTVPLQGIYVAASEFPDGSRRLIVNPAESPTFSRRVNLHIPMDTQPLPQVSATASGKDIPVEMQTAEGQVTLSLTVTERTLIIISPDHI
jgi:hypothetical protein